jgi:hypothetical protein
MSTSPRGVILPQSPRTKPPTPAARYAVYALDDLARIAFRGLAGAVGELTSRGMRVPTTLVTSRSRDQSVAGLCNAVEDALVAAVRDRQPADA